MAPKNKKKNGFFYFSLNIKENNPEFRNKRLDQVTPYASSLWSNLSKEEKDEWQAEAASRQAKENEDFNKKFTTLGTSFAIVDATLSEQEERKERMIQEVKNLVSSQTLEDLVRYPFFVIHINYTYKINDQQTGRYHYAPCEIGIVRFSINNGIEDRKHIFTCPQNFFANGIVPLGLKREALEHSEKTHHIDIDGHLDAEKNYSRVFDEIVSFIKVEGEKKLPILFTMPSDINHNVNKDSIITGLERCAAAKGYNSEDYFRVYEFQYLFRSLLEYSLSFNETKIHALPSLIDLIYHEHFYITTNTACAFHEEEGDTLRMCSLAIATRWVYSLCDHVCKSFKILPIPGRHLPHPDSNYFDGIKMNDDNARECQGAEALDDGWNTVKTNKRQAKGRNVSEEEICDEGWDLVGKKDVSSNDDGWNVVGKKDDCRDNELNVIRRRDESNSEDDSDNWPELGIRKGRGRGRREFGQGRGSLS